MIVGVFDGVEIQDPGLSPHTQQGSIFVDGFPVGIVHGIAGLNALEPGDLGTVEADPLHHLEAQDDVAACSVDTDGRGDGVFHGLRATLAAGG